MLRSLPSLARCGGEVVSAAPSEQSAQTLPKVSRSAKERERERERERDGEIELECGETYRNIEIWRGDKRDGDLYGL